MGNIFSSNNDDIKYGHWVQGLVNTWDPSRIHLLETESSEKVSGWSIEDPSI